MTLTIDNRTLEQRPEFPGYNPSTGASQMKVKKAKTAKIKGKPAAGKKAKTKAAGGKKAKMSASERKGLVTGVKTGLAVIAFWNKLLAANVKAKKTDAQLVTAFKKEFPRRDNVQPVGRVRSFFNRGVLGFGNPPGTALRGTSKTSYAYDDAGEVTRAADWGAGRPKSPARIAAGKERTAKQYAPKKTIKIKKAKGKKKSKGKKAA